jgi:primosomal protein N' (replication factor Y)
VIGPREPAAQLPVARLMIDVPLAHLDRPFDYLVPSELDDTVVAGSRVRVRFAGRLVDGFVLDRVARTEHEGRLAYLERVVGEPVLTAETSALMRAVADRWAGNFVDVVRLAVPARHARAEAATGAKGKAPTEGRVGVSGPILDLNAPSPDLSGPVLDLSRWNAYRLGPQFAAALTTKDLDAPPPRAAWTVLPGEDWTARIAELVVATSVRGRGSIVVVPDQRDLDRVDAALSSALGRTEHVALSASLGPSQRYRRWLSVRRGDVQVVAGTRAAAYAPVRDLGLLIVWDDGDDLHAEPRAPYPHIRDVLTLRASMEGAGLLIAGYTRTAETQLLVDSGWLKEIAPTRAAVRNAAPRVVPAGDDFEQGRDSAAATARLPSLAWRTARESLAAGAPVLVQVPRRGYAPALACQEDRTPARCGTCGGPLASYGPQSVPRCRWCGRPAADWTCPHCGHRRLRATVIGQARTAEELGRAFPGFPVRTSAGDSILDSVGPEPAIVVATPGAEPRAEGGYGAALLLDGWAMLSRPDLRASEEAVRRWSAAAALVRPTGTVIVGADGGLTTVQALVRWDPAGFAARELADRRELGFPPAVRMASISGAGTSSGDLLADARLPEGHEVLGPVPLADGVQRYLIRVARAQGSDLAGALHEALAARSARKAVDPVRVVLDPTELW